MASGRPSNSLLASIAIGAAIAVVGVFLYRRSGRNWDEDLESARGWLEDQTDTPKRVLDRAERASKELIASAEELGHRVTGSAKGGLEAAKSRLG